MFMKTVIRGVNLAPSFFLNCYNIMTGDIVIKKSSFLPVLETGKSDECDGRFSAWCGPGLCCVLSKVGMLCA